MHQFYFHASSNHHDIKQTQQEIEAVNPIAKLIKVDEVITKEPIDHILAVEPHRYTELKLKKNQFLIVINLQFAPFKRSLVAFNVVDLDELKQHHTEPAYILLKKFLECKGMHPHITFHLRTNSEQ